MLDCEPWVNEGWSKDEFAKAIKETTEKSSIPVMVCIPFWLESQEIVDAADGVIVMMYFVGHEGEIEKILKVISYMQICKNA